MLTTLKNSFTQAALGGTIWITVIASMTRFNQVISFNYLWHLLLIGLLCGFVFGVIYPYLWDYATFKASTNIFLSTLVNISGMVLGVKLYSTSLFDAITLYYWIGISLLTLIGHIIGFYFYSKYQNKQLKKELDTLL